MFVSALSNDEKLVRRVLRTTVAAIFGVHGMATHNYCFLLARYHVWLAKTKDDHPNLTLFICTLKSQYEIETKSGDTKKWKPLTGYMRI